MRPAVPSRARTAPAGTRPPDKRFPAAASGVRGRPFETVQAIEAAGRRISRARGPADSGSPAAREALYRSLIRHYLRLVATELAAWGGRAAPEFGQGDMPPEIAPLPGEDAGALNSDYTALADDPSGELRASARATAAAGGSPGAILSGTYALLLGYAPCAGPDFVLERSAARMKRLGSYYTPPETARLLVERSLQPIRSRCSPPAPPRILDPAMGTGVFLLAAVQALVRAGAGSAAELAETCVAGYDLDPLAVELAILSLRLETGARPDILRRRLRCLDALRDRSPAAGQDFDLVVGNPPWGAVFPRAERTGLAERYGLGARGSFDSFKLFLALAAERSRGSIGMIVPRAVLAQSGHADVRALLQRQFAPYEVHLLDAAAFPRAVAPACSLIFGPRPGPAVVRCRAGHGERGVPAAGVPARLWTSRRFPVSAVGPLGLLDRLGRRHPHLGDLGEIYRVRDAGINYNRAAIARRVLYEAEAAEHPDDLPRYRGRNFERYGPVRQGGWLRHDARRRLEPGDQLHLSLDTYRLPEKVVFRQTADRITATLDRTRMAMGRSVLAVIAPSEAPLLPLLACLNSRLLTVLYRALAGEEGRVLPQVKVKIVSLLPLPNACCDSREAGAWLELGELARARLAGADETSRQDGAIDRAVYALFGLTAGEIAAVETNVP